MIKLDRIDYRILEVLQENARLPITRLAVLANLSVSPCWQRVKRLEECGIIRRYVAEIAIEKLQLVQTILAQVVLTRHTREAYRAFEAEALSTCGARRMLTRNGGRKPKMTPAKLRLAQAAMGKPETKVGELCAELGVTRQTLYRHVDAKGTLRSDGLRLLPR